MNYTQMSNAFMKLFPFQFIMLKIQKDQGPGQNQNPDRKGDDQIPIQIRNIYI